MSTRGILMFAHNSTETDYVAMASDNAKRVSTYLNLPTTVVTDVESIKDADTSAFDTVVIIDTGKNTTRVYYQGDDIVRTIWVNGTRSRANLLSPYDQTIMIDTDYIVCSDTLLKLFDCDKPYLAHKTAFDITNRDGFIGHKTFGNRGFPMYWATVVYWKNGNDATSLFELMTMVKENYAHYATLYGFPQRPFRNDYALSIAMYALSGHTEPTNFIPWDLITANVDVGATIKDSTISLKFDVNQKPKYIVTNGIDVHVMNKRSLCQ